VTRRTITVVSPCRDIRPSLDGLCRAVASVFDALEQYDFVHVLVDDGSIDGTADAIRALAAEDPRVRGIVNVKPFGIERSEYHALGSSEGDAAILLPPAHVDDVPRVRELVAQWEAGKRMVVALPGADERGQATDAELRAGFDGFGLYDREVIAALGRYREPEPHLGRTLCEVGLERGTVRLGGRALAVPARFSLGGLRSIRRDPSAFFRAETIMSFLFAGVSFVIGMIYLVYKLLRWDEFALGMAPVVIGLFFFSSVQLIFIGVVGEYVHAILTQVRGRPRVIERERINF
jgi:hypothetical protein